MAIEMTARSLADTQQADMSSGEAIQPRELSGLPERSIPVSTSREAPKVPWAELLHPKTYPPVAYRPRIEQSFQSPFPELYFRAAPLRNLAFLLHKTPKRGICSSAKKRGRTGFDSSLEAQTACRGWFVGLVKNRTKKQTQTTKVSLSRLN